MKPKNLILIAVVCAFFLAVGPAGAQQQSQQSPEQKQAQSDSGQGQNQQMAESGPTEGARLYVSPATLRYVQKQLNTKGFNAGAIDGVWSDSTSQALAQFQRIQGLEPTGNLTIETLNYLGVAQALRQGDQVQEMVWAESVGEGAPLFVSPDGVRQIQEQLSQNGFDPGPIDGIWGPNTKQALSDYQKDRGIKPSENISLRLISSIGLNDMLAGLVEQDQQQVAQQGQQQQQQTRGYYGPEGQKTDPAQTWEQRSGEEGTLSLFGPERRQSPTSQGAPLFVSAEVVQQIQEKLSQAGFEAGNTEGNWDNATSQALRNYQEANNLEPTGNLNIRTMTAMLGGLSADLFQGGGQQQNQGQQNPPQNQQNQQNQDQQAQ